MADGFDIHLDHERAERLRRAADASGVSPADLALRVLDEALDADRIEDRRRWDEYKRTGETISAEDWMSGLREAVLGKPLR